MSEDHEGREAAALIAYDVSDGICVLRLDSPPLNTITFPLLEELRASVRRANADDAVRGIVITGGARHFSAGADVNLFKEIACAEDAVRASRVFQEAFGGVEGSAKPVAAAVAGKVMGSALELAMSCHLRVCAKDTRFSMPEVDLGINPGAGGTQRLPRLVGAGPALKMLLTAKPVGAEEALALGLVDAVCEADELVDRARELVRSVESPLRTCERADRISDAAANDTAFREAEKLLADVRLEIIAPSRIARAVKVGLTESFAAGLAQEQKAFAECMATPATRNRIYLFFATRGTSKAPALADAEPAPVAKAAVVGMGSMGTGIAHALAIAGVPVVAIDEDDRALRKGVDRIAKSIEKRVAQGKLSGERRDAMLKLISTTTEWRRIADADLVIEAVFEDVDTKRAVIARIEADCPSGAVIASNTSTISLDALAEGMRAPGRLVGMHFFNPAHRMPLVEVIRRDEADGRAVATALAFAKKIRKTPVLVGNREGFLVNRIFIPYLKEAFWLLEDGAEPAAVDRAMVEFGFPMGPLVLIDMAGLDILAFTDDVMHRAFPRHGPLSQVARRLVESGHLGQKTGSGVYRYEKGDYTPRPSEAAEGAIAEVRREAGRGAREVDAGEITERLVLRMVSEAFYVLEEGIAQRESDIDAAMVLATGFPDFRGGVLKYARELGVETVLARLERLTESFGERFSPCGLLQEGDGF